MPHRSQYGTSDTAKALVHLFRRKNRTGKIFIYASSALLVGGGISFAASVNTLSNRGIPTPYAPRILRRAWLVYGTALAYGIAKTQRWSRKSLMRVLDGYDRDGSLPGLYRRKLRPKYFR